MSNNIDELEDGMAESAQLKVSNVELSIGGLRILNDVSFEAEKGNLLALIGPNGAGKTSLLNCMNGIYHPTNGRILFEDHDISRSRPYEIAEMGIARTFQHAELFRGMSVLQNIFMGRHLKMNRGLLSNGVFWGKSRAEEIAHREVVEEIIEFLELEKYRKKKR